MTEETTETPRERKNRLARERRAAKKAQQAQEQADALAQADRIETEARPKLEPAKGPRTKGSGAGLTATQLQTRGILSSTPCVLQECKPFKSGKRSKRVRRHRWVAR